MVSVIGFRIWFACFFILGLAIYHNSSKCNRTDGVLKTDLKCVKS